MATNVSSDVHNLHYDWDVQPFQNSKLAEPPRIEMSIIQTHGFIHA